MSIQTKQRDEGKYIGQNGDGASLEIREGLLQGERPQTVDGDYEDKTEDEGISVFCSQRWILAYMGLLHGLISYTLRVNMSVAIVSMADSSTSNRSMHDVTDNRTALYLNADNVTDDITLDKCERLSLGGVAQEYKPPELDWDKTTQSLVLSAFFYGYMITQIPGGWVAGRYGGKNVIGVAHAMTSILTMLTPVCARAHAYLVIVIRVIIGLCQGAAFPAYFALVGDWALPEERSRFMAMFWFGQVLGAIIGYSSAGYLCVAGFDNGWGSVFYIHGICGIIITICWCLLVFDSHENHPRITEREKQMIGRALRHTVGDKMPEVPWVHILTSLPIWSIFITHLADAWLIYLLMTCLPLFVNDVLKFDIQSNGVFSSLPFLTMAVGLALSGVLADLISSRKWVRIITTRKTFQCTGLILSAVFIVISGYITCDKYVVAIVCLCLCTFFEAWGVGCGYPCSALDMAPRFASVIFGISNTLASVSGIVSPVVVAEMTRNGTQEEWRHVFYLTAGIAGVAAVVYGLGASSDLAKWAGQEPADVTIDISTKQGITIDNMPTVIEDL